MIIWVEPDYVSPVMIRAVNVNFEYPLNPKNISEAFYVFTANILKLFCPPNPVIEAHTQILK